MKPYLDLVENKPRLFAVAKVDPTTGKVGWRLSFSEFEKIHIKSLDTPADATKPHVSRKLSLRVVKYLTQGKRPKTLKTFLLKNMWLDFVESNAWRLCDAKAETQRTFVLALLDHMIKMLQSGNVSLYFAPTINLWKPADDRQAAIDCLVNAWKVVRELQP